MTPASPPVGTQEARLTTCACTPPSGNVQCESTPPSTGPPVGPLSPEQATTTRTATPQAKMSFIMTHGSLVQTQWSDGRELSEDLCKRGSMPPSNAPCHLVSQASTQVAMQTVRYSYMAIIWSPRAGH